MVELDRFIATQYVPLVRRVLIASENPELVELGKAGKIKYLVEDAITQATLDIQDAMIAAVESGERPPDAARRFEALRNAIQPYVGKQLLRAGLRSPARQYEVYFDPISETVLHFAGFDAGFDWPDSIENDPAYLHWLDSTLFPEDFFDESVFETSRTLYHVELHESLLEDAIYRGIEPARFQRAELNAAIRTASTGSYGHCEAKWFHVNVHDNAARFVEKYGSYSFDFPLEPIYMLLQYHQAQEGGTTYAGLASAHREWVLLFTDSLTMSVHGETQFVDHVVESLKLNTNA